MAPIIQQMENERQKAPLSWQKADLPAVEEMRRKAKVSVLWMRRLQHCFVLHARPFLALFASATDEAASRGCKLESGCPFRRVTVVLTVLMSVHRWKRLASRQSSQRR